MSDNGKNKNPAQEAGMQGNTSQAPLTVLGQYVKDFSFESPNAPDILASPISDPKIDVDVNVDVNPRENANEFEVVLAIRADAKASGKQAFLIELSYAGVFNLGAELPEEHRHPVLLIECPRLLFPFARQLIAEATQEGGFMPLLLQPIDFTGLYQQEASKQGDAPGSTGGSSSAGGGNG